MDAPYPTRENREAERQKRFRAQYIAATPSWYRGEYHLAFMLAVTLGTIAFCWSRLDHPTVYEWLMLVPIFLFGNWVEWAGHRYLLHRPVKGLEMVYKRHCGVHHQFFTDHDLTYKGQKEWRALLFPPFAPMAFLLMALPPALVAGALWSANAAYIAMLGMAGYYLMYEGLHTLSHLSDERYPYLRHIPLVNTVRRMHVTHHKLGFMQTRNFNLTFPLCDARFGTSDLDRGVLGTLFNGPSNAQARRDLRPDRPPAEFGPAEDRPAGHRPA
ncbi:MAG TPA: sterol desaturase family protein [Stellaceae bacterium]